MSILIKTHIKDTPPINLRLNINLKTMEINDEERDDGDRVYELEEASETVDEVKTHVVPANSDEALCNKLLNFPSPKVALSRTGIKSTCMEQMMFLKKWILVD